MKYPKTPKNNSRKFAAAAAIAVIVGASVATRSGSALPTSDNQRSDAGVMSVEEEFSDFVHGAIAKNAASKSFGEWESSGFTPEDIIANAAARRGGKKQAFAALCTVLGTIDDASLALFQNSLVEPQVRAEMHCARDLSMRLQAYWESRRAALQTESDATHMDHPEFAEKDDQLPTLPSEEVHVDTSKGETLYGIAREGYLKPGEIAITIDDGPHPTITRKILNTLKTYGVRSNFFSVGRPAKVWPDLDKAEIAEGHITGSHTMTHPDLAKMDIKSAEAEITGARKVIADAAGEAIPFFRFPYGSHNGVLDAFIKQQQMTSFLWNMDSEDWKRPDPTDLFHNEVAQLNNAKGGIILMHDIHEQTAIALPHLLDELRHRGWKTVLFVPH